MQQERAVQGKHHEFAQFYNKCYSPTIATPYLELIYSFAFTFVTCPVFCGILYQTRRKGQIKRVLLAMKFDRFIKESFISFFVISGAV